MKNKLFYSCLIMIYFFILSSGSYSQSQNTKFICGTGKMEACNPDPAAVTNIPKITPGTNEFLRALFIYVVFPDDTLSNYSYTIWDKPTTQFPATRPVNPYTGTQGKLVWPALGNKNQVMDRYPDYTISDFFCEMTSGQLDLIGDEVNIVLPHTSNYYDSTLHYKAPEMNTFVLHYVDSVFNIDWTRYDNWAFRNGQWVFSAKDSTVELVVINYRTIPHNETQWFWSASYGGLASLLLTQDVFFNTTKITCNSGVTVLNNRNNTTHSELSLEHEICHKFFGMNLIGSDGWHDNIGMMTASITNSTYTMSPYERTIIPSYVPTPVNINSTGIYTLNLNDYISTGQIINIYIVETGDVFYLTNNQKISKYDGVSRGGKQCTQINFAEQDPYCSDGKGLFIWRQGSGCYNVNYPFEIISAEGKFNWSIFRWVFVPSQNNQFGFELPIFKYISSNSINGRDTYEKAPDYPESNYGQYLNYDDCSDNSNDFFITFDLYGSGKTGFNKDYNEIFSPYSNPSSNTCKNPASTGLTIHLASQNSLTGEMQLKIYYNKNDSALLECPPSKPKTPKIDKQFVEPRTSFNPLISWERNTEPDVISNGNYKIYRGLSDNCYSEPVYAYIATISSTDSSYLDNDILLYVQPQVNNNHLVRKLTVSYKIVANDNQNMVSVNSEHGIIFGYNDNIILSSRDSNFIPAKFSLYQNVPNPFNSSTKISYDVPGDGFVTLKVYDILGREIETLVNDFKRSGRYSIDFNNINLSSGIYFYRLQFKNFSNVKTMVVIK